MKIVLSRKGFDSSAGGVASPILEDGTLLSLPIPDPRGTYCLDDLHPGGQPLGPIARDLSKGAITPANRVHLDPDLDPTTVPRRPGWTPAFGQSAAAARHLERKAIGRGDVFLFFGWFRQVERIRGQYRYHRGAPDLHVLFGWLVVQNVIVPDHGPCPAGLERHPHFDGSPRLHNRVYVGISGGPFQRFSRTLQLTAPDECRSRWRLPRWFLPATRPPLSYHSNPKRWRSDATGTLLDAVGRGQEFVLDAAAYPEAHGWLDSLLACAV